jgi:hypothetical protein
MDATRVAGPPRPGECRPASAPSRGAELSAPRWAGKAVGLDARTCAARDLVEQVCRTAVVKQPGAHVRLGSSFHT